MAPNKPVLPPLTTSKTATFPSEIPTSRSGQPEPKSEKSMSTPIAPPIAYTEFLKAMSPIFHSPVSPAMNFPRYPGERVPPSAASQPSTATSVSFPNGSVFMKSESTSPETGMVTPISAKSSNGRKKLRVSTAKGSRKGMSPATDSPRSATSTAYTPYSPADWKLRYLDEGAQISNTGNSVCIRQVITRTITYKRTPLEPVPKGKRRRTASESSQSS